MKAFLSLFSPKLPLYFVYMLQQVEYEPKKFSEWFKRLIKGNKPVQSVMHRQNLVLTKRALSLVLSTYVLTLLFVVVYLWFVSQVFNIVIVSVVALLALPQVVRFFVWAQAYGAHRFIVAPQQERLLAEATRVFKDHKGIKIAVLGSYGKTTMKEMLKIVLAEGKQVAATPGNMNVSVSHAKFARSLHGNEEVLIVEFGEGEPGDIARMAAMLQPDYAVLTGLAPNHLDHYKDLDAVATDLLTIYDYVDADKVLVNGDSQMLSAYLPKNAVVYSEKGVSGWSVKDVKQSIDGLIFKLVKGKRHITIRSGLLGSYQIGPLSAVAAIGQSLGIDVDSIESGMEKTKPYDHRMQPRLVHGAWLIDDAYNGNLEGMQAGLRLLAELPARRKWYVTPGLVDQGVETDRVHTLLGEAIARAKPDIVVLMENSVRKIIEAAMRKHGFSGEIRIEDDPLGFYTSLEHTVAAGDLILMQNDWTDNYN